MFEQPWAFISNNRGVYRGSQSIRAFQVYGLSNRSITFQVDSFSLDFFPLPFSFLFFFLFFSLQAGRKDRLSGWKQQRGQFPSVQTEVNGSLMLIDINWPLCLQCIAMSWNHCCECETLRILGDQITDDIQLGIIVSRTWGIV